MRHLSCFVTILRVLLIFVTITAAEEVEQPQINLTDRYVIVLHPKADLSIHLDYVQSIHRASAADGIGNQYAGLTHNYTIGTFQGYAGHFDRSVIAQLKAHKDVQDVELDYLMTLDSLVTQEDAPWNLNLISHISKYQQHMGYTFDIRAGEGTFAYLVDSGIDVNHYDFEGRARTGYLVPHSGGSADLVGHGTKSAGIVGGRRYGVAKRCQLISVKAFTGRQTEVSQVLSGYDWAHRHIKQRGREATAVIGLFACGPSLYTPMDQAIDAAYATGVLTITSAGNHGVPADHIWGTRSAVIVGATDRNRWRMPKSNYGPRVDLFAPGDAIETTTPGSRTGYASGTSPAAAHVVGLALYMKSIAGRTLSASSTKKLLMQRAISGDVIGPRGSANEFAYNGCGR